jgi:hypothetical protein
MARDEITFTRDELYEMVWKEPMSHIAKRHGISDVGLAKRCRRLKVPVPSRGYWAKIAAGKTNSLRPVLPPAPPLVRTELRSRRAGRRSTHPQSDRRPQERQGLATEERPQVRL